MALLVLPDSLYPAKPLMDLMVKKDIFHVIFYEHPKWFKADHHKLVFLRAAMQNLYDDYYDNFHDDKTTFDYIECGNQAQLEKTLKLYGKPFVFHESDIDSVPIFKAQISSNPTYHGLIMPTAMPVVLSDKSRFSWIAADTYVTEVLGVPGELPTIQPTWTYDVNKSVDRFLRHMQPGDLPEYLKWLIDHRMVKVKTKFKSAVNDY